MNLDLYTAPVCVGELFNDPFQFTVPDYQRPFSWSPTEAGQLLDDLLLALGDDPRDPHEPDYFLGAILLQDPRGTGDWRRGQPAGTRNLDIVDGQQRIVTLTVLLSVLRELDTRAQAARPRWPVSRASVSRTRVPDLLASRVVLQGPAQAAFDACLKVVRGGTTKATPIEDDDADDEEPGPADPVRNAAAALTAVRAHFRAALSALNADERARLASYLVERCYVVVIITSDLDRGHRMFMVLNDRGRPLARADIIKAEILADLPPAPREAATTAWTAAEARFGENLDLFFSHMRAAEGRERLPVIAGVRALKRDAGGAEPFLSEVFLPYAEAYARVRGQAPQQPDGAAELGRLLAYLNWHTSTDWVPAALTWLRRNDAASAETLSFFRKLDRFTYLMRVLCVGTEKRAARCAALAAAIRGGARLPALEPHLAFSDEEMRRIAANLRGLHARNTGTCKLVLMRLNDLIAGAPQSIDPRHYSIEHVLPQKPGKRSLWRTWFPDPDVRERCTRSLGNMVLVTPEQNDLAANKEFARKRGIYFETPGKPSLAITRDIAGRETWEPQNVLEREAKFLSLLTDLWQIKPA